MEKSEKYFIFGLENELYALPLSSIDKIIQKPRVTLIPNSQNYFCGIINVYGDLVPLIDTKKRLGIKDLQKGRKTIEELIIIIKQQKDKYAITIDSTENIAQLSNIETYSWKKTDLVNKIGFYETQSKNTEFEKKMILILESSNII